MGAKAWFTASYTTDPKVTLAQNPQLDRAASRALAAQLLPDERLEDLGEGSLDMLNPRKGQLFVGVYGDLKIIAHQDIGIDFPSRIESRWRPGLPVSTAYTHAIHSTVDWFAFSLWKDGVLRRSLSISPDNGVQEDVGDRFPFEQPYWDGKHALEDDYPLPFHPLELAEAALLATLGFQFEGYPDDWVCDPMEIPILRFSTRTKPRWKFW